LLRQSVFGRLAGYEDVNDAEMSAIDGLIRTWSRRIAYTRASWTAAGTRPPDRGAGGSGQPPIMRQLDP